MSTPKIDNSIVGNRSDINLSCNWTGSSDFGRIVPFSINELIPTDKVKTCRPKIEIQLLSLASPTFGKMDMYLHYFFVPHRLCFDAFDDFISNKGGFKNVPPPFVYRKDLTRWYNSLSLQSRRSLYKHWSSLGLPPFWTGTVPNDDRPFNYEISMLPFRAYQQIWWDFFRDPELLPDESKENFIFTTGGRTNPTEETFEQRTFVPRNRQITNNWIANLFVSPGGIQGGYDTGLVSVQNKIQTAQDGIVDQDGENTLSNAASKLRTLEALARLSERLSLSGKREIEQFYAHYGLKPNFQKMKMCEYVGGAKETFDIQTITSSANTVSSLDNTSIGSPLGAKSGEGYLNFANLDIDYEANEHGYLIGVLSIVPHVHFVQGLNKMWLRNYREDFFQKSLELTGQVAVSKGEIAMDSANKPYTIAEDVDIFAFDQPYYEYKRGQDILAGDMMFYHNDNSLDDQGNVKSDLRYLHSMEMYADYPVSRTYTADNMQVNAAPFNKVFYYEGGNINTNSDDHFHICIDKDIVINRPMEAYAIPTLETTKDPHESTTSLSEDVIL